MDVRELEANSTAASGEKTLAARDRWAGPQGTVDIHPSKAFVGMKDVPGLVGRVTTSSPSFTRPYWVSEKDRLRQMFLEDGAGGPSVSFVISGWLSVCPLVASDAA